MIEIAITEAAFEAIAATLPLGSWDSRTRSTSAARGSYWLAPRDRPLRGSGDTFSDVILRIAGRDG
jgi:hypothetical protein